MAATTIQWTATVLPNGTVLSGYTFNPWRGCTKIGPGCTFCYADRQSHRNPKVLGVWGPKGTRVLAADAQWRTVTKWNAAAEFTGYNLKVFCASLADIFEDWDGQMTDSQERQLWKYPLYERPEESPRASRYQRPPGGGMDWQPYTLNDARARLWALIRKTPHLTWQLLTKRPENIGRMMPSGDWPNVWLGVSVESQEYTWRIDVLADVPQKVPVRFVSAEPLLGPLDLTPCIGTIQWCIVGGESGGQARSMNVDWVREIIAQCEEADVAVFVKQFGKAPVSGDPAWDRPGLLPLRMTHDPAHGGDMLDWPEDCRVRQMPV